MSNPAQTTHIKLRDGRVAMVRPPRPTDVEPLNGVFPQPVRGDEATLRFSSL